ncbi:unannotated protein [freshwater metagenome]|uniref:Unannotated protein n=1 Tax=freshwater metagenome TaxID=449393 RepID=A0A6J6YF75_9ZZZZ
MFEECTCNEVESIAIFGQDRAATFLGLPQDAFDFFVDHTSGVIGVVTRMHEVFAEENLTLRAPGHGANPSTHAPFSDHLAGEFGCPDEIVIGAGGDDIEHELFCHATAHTHDQHVLDVVLSVNVAFFDR